MAVNSSTCWHQLKCDEKLWKNEEEKKDRKKKSCSFEKREKITCIPAINVQREILRCDMMIYMPYGHEPLAYVIF